MQKNIKFLGISVKNSEHEAPEGSLDVSLNLINEKGALNPILNPSLVLELPSNDLYVAFIHKTASYTHYIIASTKSTRSIWWINENIQTPKASDLILIKDLDAKVSSIQAVGNTLIITTETGINYTLWKGDINNYQYLGSHLPESDICFSLIYGSLERLPIFDYNYAERVKMSAVLDRSYNFSVEEKNKATNEILGKVNKFVEEYGSKKGRFLFPFLIRYAYRLYDGSLTMHSAPILMLCCNAQMPRIRVTDYDDDSNGNIYVARLRVMGLFHQLYIAPGFTPSYLEPWSDIISSVDIFISAPFYTYDQSGTIEPHLLPELYNSDETRNSLFYIESQKINFWDFYDDYLANLKSINPGDRDDQTGWAPFHRHLELPHFTQEALQEKIKNCAQFYLLKSYTIDELTEISKLASGPVEIPEDYLQSLTSRELMTDDYQSHDAFIPEVSSVYNNRLNIACVKRIPFVGFKPSCMIQNTYDMYASQTYLKAYVYIRSDNGTIVRSHSFDAQNLRGDTPILWLFYPDTNAYKMVIQTAPAIIQSPDAPGSSFYEVKLTPHPTLNGAYWFDGWDGACNPKNQIFQIPVLTPNDLAFIPASNKLYTSEVNNPFFFPLSGVINVGAGSILGIASAARPLSQGQFGQFPLYAFTTEGVWALEVSSTGNYSARQPISRDICINPDSITPIDSAVIFATNRGIMIISGSNVLPISDEINSEFPFNIHSLPSFNQIIEAHAPGIRNIISPSNSDYNFPIPFSNYLEKGRIVYDYTNQRILIFDPQTNETSFSPNTINTPTLVFSLESKMWGSLASQDLKLISAPNAYPLAYIMDNKGKLLNFSVNDKASASPISPQLIVSRPFGLSDPDILKTINAAVLRGFFRKGKLKCMLYASRDLFNWHLVKSSVSHEIRNISGSPFKYFRIIIIADLEADESIHALAVSFLQKFNNKLR